MPYQIYTIPTINGNFEDISASKEINDGIIIFVAMITRRPVLIVVVGPTAVGKTSFSIKLARHYGSEIISADSRQFFQEMTIGTAKPTEHELAQIKHHFINNLSIHDDFSTVDFESEALRLLHRLYKKQPLAILTGGSGLYVKAVCEGLDEIPQVDASLRIELNMHHREKGLEYLQQLLRENDPEYYELVDLANPQRVIRALEVCLGTGRPYSGFLSKKGKERPFQIIKIGLELPRKVLYERINQRMDLMIESGLFEEAEQLYPVKHLNALQTVGYKEIFDFMESKYDKEEAIRLLKRNSRRYAKRQLTWFKKDASISWYSPLDFDAAVNYVDLQIS